MPEWNGVRAGGLPAEALNRIRRYRHGRLLEVMRARQVPALLFYAPINIRYATDARNMQVYALNHDARSAFIGADGLTVLLDWFQGDVYFGHLPCIEQPSVVAELILEFTRGAGLAGGTAR